MARARVIVGFDPSSAGGNALWWAVRETRRRGAVLFVVCARPLYWPPIIGNRSPTVPGLPRGSDQQVCALQAVEDALLLAVGALPPGLEVWVAPVTGELPARLLEFADRPDDLLVVATSARRTDRLCSWGQWRSPAYWRRRHDGELLLALGDRDHERLPRTAPSGRRRRTP